MPWLDRLAQATGTLAGTKGAILCFHGLDVPGSPSRASMHVPREHFEAVVTAVQNHGTLVPLREIVTRHLAGRSTAKLIALTADDAYASWLDEAPFLASGGIPFTIFAVGNALNAGPRFWWDQLDDSASWSRLERWRQFEDECGLPEAYRRGQPASAGLARALRQWVLAEHAGRWPSALQESLERLERDLGRHTLQRAMTETELAAFLDRSGAEVAVHTHSHAALPFLQDQEVVAEVRKGHEALLARFPATLPYLAIPFGLFDTRTSRLAAEAGMVVSFTLEGQPLDRPFVRDIGMPRLCVVREDRPGMLTLKTSAWARPLKRLRSGEPGSYPVLPSANT